MNGDPNRDVVVVRSGQLSSDTAQTPGMPRLSAIDPRTGSKKLWVGRVTGLPLMDSGAHHHGEAETVGYVLAGNVRIRFGDHYERSVELNAGDFIYIAPYVPHIEQNPNDAPVEFVTIRTPDNIVVRLPEPHDP